MQVARESVLPWTTSTQPTPIAFPTTAFLSAPSANDVWALVGGSRLFVSLDRGQSWRTVVGVVGDVRQTGLAQEPKDSVYLPFLQFPGFTSSLFVRTVVDPRAVADQVRAAVRVLEQ